MASRYDFDAEETALSCLEALLRSPEHHVVFVQAEGEWGRRLRDLLAHRLRDVGWLNGSMVVGAKNNLAYFTFLPAERFDTRYVTDVVTYLPGALRREERRCKGCDMAFPTEGGYWCPRCKGWMCLDWKPE